MEPITVPQAVEIINERLAQHPVVHIYGQWHCGPGPVWGNSDINIDAGYGDTSSDYDVYKTRFAKIAALLRTQGHMVEDRGTMIHVYRRGSDEALKEAVRQGTQAGINPGDIVILWHNCGTECKRVIRTDETFLHFEGRSELPMSRVWVCDVLRTSIPIQWFKQTLSAHWIGVTDLQAKTFTYMDLGDMCCISKVIRELAKETPRQFRLAEYDGWGEMGGPGELISELGIFTIYRVGMQVFINRDSED